jgi:hypothetical protein
MPPPVAPGAPASPNLAARAQRAPRRRGEACSRKPSRGASGRSSYNSESNFMRGAARPMVLPIPGVRGWPSSPPGTTESFTQRGNLSASVDVTISDGSGRGSRLEEKRCRDHSAACMPTRLSACGVSEKFASLCSAARAAGPCGSCAQPDRSDHGVTHTGEEPLVMPLNAARAALSPSTARP